MSPLTLGPNSSINNAFWNVKIFLRLHRKKTNRFYSEQSFAKSERATVRKNSEEPSKESVVTYGLEKLIILSRQCQSNQSAAMTLLHLHCFDKEWEKIVTFFINVWISFMHKSLPLTKQHTLTSMDANLYVDEIQPHDTLQQIKQH